MKRPALKDMRSLRNQLINAHMFLVKEGSYETTSLNIDEVRAIINTLSFVLEGNTTIVSKIYDTLDEAAKQFGQPPVNRIEWSGDR